MNLNKVSFLVFLIFIAACNLGGIDAKNVKYKTVVKNATYKISIPDFLDSTTKLNAEANLQFSNGPKEFYVVVFNEEKEKLEQLKLVDEKIQEQFPDSLSMLNNYFIFMTRHMREKSDFTMFDTATTAIKKATIKTASVNLSLKGNNIFYRVAAIESKSNLYQVYVWTLDKSRKKYEPIMDSIIHSFSEL